MGTASLILLVCFILVMFLWLLAMLGGIGITISFGWLAFFACLLLGVAVFAKKVP